MGLDSVEIVLGWEEAFGIRLANEEVEVLRTPAQAVALIAGKLGASENRGGVCLSMRAFGRVRRALVECANIERAQIRPKTILRNLLKGVPGDVWGKVQAALGLARLPAPKRGLAGFFFAPTTVADLMSWTITNSAKTLKPAGEAWTQSEVRQVVRAVVEEQVGVRGFGDEDDFIRDIGID